MAAVFGWTLDQVLSLTWSQFAYVSEQLEALRSRRALSEVFFGVAAALSEDYQKKLFDCSPGLLREQRPPVFDFTPELLKAAEARAQEYFARQNKER